ncbi:TonB-dependent Receptor Plug Domain [Sphingobium faniae]|nr:TonB-dependent Receptor Plug Domain [Sphingobium faniae]
MTSRSVRWYVSSALCAAGALVAYPVAAQEVGGASSQASGGLDDIVVTAQRRAQNLQDVPLSIVAVTPDVLARTGMATLEALNNLIPNAVIEHVGLFPGVASLSIRGVGVSGIESFADPQVAVYINGVYQARNVNALSSTVDVATVEVLRGPQGTLYGRNAYSGAISLRTNRPEMNEIGGSAVATIANYGKVDVDLVGNVPIVEGKVAARLAMRSHNFDGFWKNHGVMGPGVVDSTLKGKSIGGEKSLYVRPSIRFTPTENWDISVIGEIMRERSDGYVAGQVVLPGSTLEALGYPGFNPFGDKSLGIKGDGSNPYRAGFSLGDRPTNNDQWNVTTDAAYTTDAGTIRALVNYSRATSEIWTDTDGANVNAFSTARWETYRAFSGELQFVSDFSDRLDVVAGLFYLWDQYNTTQLSFTDFTLPFVDEFTIADPDQNPGYINTEGKRRTWAAYAQVEYKLTPKLSVVLGGRYSYEKKYGVRGQNAVFSATGLSRDMDFSDHIFSANNAIVFGPGKKAWDSFSPRVGVNYHASKDVMLFGFWQRAFKSGGFNANSSDRVAFVTPFGQERVDNFEVGIKSDWFDRRLRFNVNAFYSKFDGLQRSLVMPTASSPNGVTTVTQNVADMESYGIEAEISARPMRQLTLFANIGWNHASYTSYCADLDGAEATQTPVNGRAVCGPVTTVTSGGTDRYLVPTDFSDLRPMRAPRWDITLGVVKDFTVGAGTVSFNGSMNYRSSLYTQLLNVPYSYRPSMVLLDSSVKWAPDNGRYEVTLWGKNLTNRIEMLNYLPVSTLFADYHATNPRTYGVTLGVKF